MPKLRDNRLSTLNNKNNISTGNNTDRNIKQFKRKLYNTRRPTNINRYIDDESSASFTTRLPDGYIGVSQTNFIPCPDCNNLIDIRDHLEQQNEKINCPKCGLYDIDLIVELKRNNKLELLASSGFPSGNLVNPPKITISDVLVRSTHIKKSYVRDAETGVKRRVYEEKDSTINTNRNRNQKRMNKDIMNEYNEQLQDDEKEIIKPLKSLIDKGLQITGVYDI